MCTHSLPHHTFKLQAAIGRSEEALADAEEAVLIYTENAPQIQQELGANAFHALSLRLATSGKLYQALTNAEQASELYRELAALAPRHLPTLANSLLHQAWILQNVGHQDESISMCKEAVSIMRNVIDLEAYFLPVLAKALDQLSDYLSKKGNLSGAAAMADECAGIRRRVILFFERAKDLSDDKEEGDAGGWETALELDTEHGHNPLLLPDGIIQTMPPNAPAEMWSSGNLANNTIATVPTNEKNFTTESCLQHKKTLNFRVDTICLTLEVNLSEKNRFWILGRTWIVLLTLSAILAVMLSQR
ncbi:hypothetical protein K438DRAFT_1818127 [Mycena galopus ATCC 62051]|nr:hypothetical protein K438DRAFT_1818127 [Mycena galopus ATCC 62051]